MSSLTERQIQQALYVWRFRKGDLLWVPNSCCFGWEADFISLSRAMYATEYEIKISVADFKAEFKKKPDKHNHLLNEKKSRPNYFYFVAPTGLIGVEDVPEYAGLILIAKNGLFPYNAIQVVKKARLLHKRKLSEQSLMQLAKSLCYRFWRMRGLQKGIDDKTS
ncbi:MAG: hypothetical protein HY231_23605 [Acidobacteria bacterium]|nr:hypothetical protein [Acidobacteriota bacterium]